MNELVFLKEVHRLTVPPRPQHRRSRGAVRHIQLGAGSAGSNNSRVVGLLPQLLEFYIKEATHHCVVRVARRAWLREGVHDCHSDRHIYN